MSNLSSLTSAQLKRAADLKDKIGALEQELASIFGTSSAQPPTPKKKSGMSAAGRARVAAAQKARWAKVKASKPAKSVVKKSGMSAAGRAKIAAAQKARWAKAKAAGKATL